jgi:hypothetical protein
MLDAQLVQRVKATSDTPICVKGASNSRPASAHEAQMKDLSVRDSASPRLHRQIKPPLPQFQGKRKPVATSGPQTATRPYTTSESSCSGWSDSPQINAPHYGATHFMYPYVYAPMMVPVPSVYGQIQPHTGNGATVVYTSGPIPANTTSIIFVPMTQAPSNSIPSQPMTPSTCMTGCGSSVSSEPVCSDQPMVVFIERNSFKPWFEGNVPGIMQNLPLRLKRYKSVETFVHWLTSRKKYATLELSILIRVTEINRLLSEVKNVKTLRIFAYEHLFDPTQQPSRSTRTLFTETDCMRKDFDQQKLVVSNCLEEACGKLVEFHHQRPLAPTN